MAIAHAVRISSSHSGSQARTVLSIASRQRAKNRGGRRRPFQKIGYKEVVVDRQHGEKALEDYLLAFLTGALGEVLLGFR